MLCGSDVPSMARIHGERHPFLHFAMSHIDVVGSEMRFSNQSFLACQRVALSTVLRQWRSGPCALLTSAAVMAHASFHHASPFGLWDIFLEKNLPHVVFVRCMRSSLACMSDRMSSMRGHGNWAKAVFQSCSIWSSINQPI